MAKAARLFRIVQILRRATRPVTAHGLAGILEVSPRTIYRDIQALQASGVPLDGSPGIGYAIGSCADISSLMLSHDEFEAVAKGLDLVRMGGDASLTNAATSAHAKLLTACADGGSVRDFRHPPKPAVPALPPTGSLHETLRVAIRDCRKLRLELPVPGGGTSCRTVCPLALIDHSRALILTVWMQDRCNFQEIRVDTIMACEMLDDTFAAIAGEIRTPWIRATAGRGVHTGRRLRFAALEEHDLGR